MGRFKVPSADDVKRAMASKETTPKAAVVNYYGPLFDDMAASADAALAPKMIKPGPGDWLWDHEEKGQAYMSFQRGMMKAVPHGAFNTIALVVLGGGLGDDILAKLRRYVEAFYQLHVEVVRVDIEKRMADGTVAWREHPETGRQLICNDAMDAASAAVRGSRDLARRTIATIGVTMIDLTPGEDWNFVYGQADLADGKGVFSLARFSPEFNGEPCESRAASDRVVLERAAKVITHELGHMFGLRHCIYFNCLMCGANNADELAHKQPHLECPACCKKLTASFNWDLRTRYADLIAVCADIGLAEPLERLTKVHAHVTAFHAAKGAAPALMGTTYKRDGADAGPSTAAPMTGARKCKSTVAVLRKSPPVGMKPGAKYM